VNSQDGREEKAIHHRVALLGCVQAARADDHIVGPGRQAAVEKMIPAFEKQTGHKVKATFGSARRSGRSQTANHSTCRSCSRRFPKSWLPATS
jgi:hypothetical protein